MVVPAGSFQLMEFDEGSQKFFLVVGHVLLSCAAKPSRFCSEIEWVAHFCSLCRQLEKLWKEVFRAKGCLQCHPVIDSKRCGGSPSHEYREKGRIAVVPDDLVDEVRASEDKDRESRLTQ